MPSGPGEDRRDIKEMNKAEWVWALATYEAVIRLTPDKEAALDELEKSRKAGPPKRKTE